MLMLGGAALRGKAMELAGRISAKTGCRLMAEYNNARMESGAGRVAIDRLPYVVDNALAAMKGTRQLVLAGAKSPVTFFAYPGKPSVLAPDDCKATMLADVADDLEESLAALAAAVGASQTPPAPISELKRPALPTGAVTPDGIATVLAALLPENAVVADESITAGRNLGAFMATRGAARLAADPRRLHRLGTARRDRGGRRRARPQSRRAGRRRQRNVHAAGPVDHGAREPGRHGGALRQPLLRYPARRAARHGRHARAARAGYADARPALPRLDSLARGQGVEAARAETLDEFAQQLKRAFSRKGPYLIELVI